MKRAVSGASRALDSSALPNAVSNSALPGAAWPAVPGEAASRLLALQFQFEPSQWWPPEVIEARRFEPLRQALAHAPSTPRTSFFPAGDRLRTSRTAPVIGARYARRSGRR